ncbi:uncharacterized protein [Diadema antillarum]|uniref:uncharacterized protein n=1 Tax=Diadema antillarum TaxID=105358 RepID=UPI003A8597A8
MAAAAEPGLTCVEATVKSPHIANHGPNGVACDSRKNHIQDKEFDASSQTSTKKKGKKRQGRRKDKSSSNGIHTSNLHQEGNDQKQGGISIAADKDSRRTATDVIHKDTDGHMNNQVENHVSEPLAALTQMVANFGVEDESPRSQLESPNGDLDVPLDPSSRDGGIEESLAIAKCNSEDEDELPSSLSDFVLGYHDECHYAATKLPPNDDDIDTIAFDDSEVRLVPYESELQMPDIIRLITKDLSEPYSIYTYRYFIHNWPNLCFVAMHGSQCVGAIVCKLDVHKKMVRRGYIAMLAVDEDFRKKKLGSSLVKKAIRAMVRGECDEVVLETEITNKPALRLYENLGFVRDKRLFRYYLNGVDALRLKLWLR